MPKSKKQATDDTTPETPARPMKKQAATTDDPRLGTGAAGGKPKRGRPKKEAARRREACSCTHPTEEGQGRDAGTENAAGSEAARA